MSPRPCDEPGCTSPAIGYVPLEEDFLLCEGHFDEKQAAGQIVCFLDEEVCPSCEGRSLRSSTIRCSTCRNSGVIERRQRRCCTKCGGTGEAPPMGRPRGSVKKSFVGAPAMMAA